MSGFIDEGLLKDSNSQLVVIENDTGTVIADTAGEKEIVKLGYKYEGYNSIGYGLIDLQKIRDSLTDEQFKEITDYLTIKRNDGKKYELVCTKFQFVYYDVIPLELKVIINSGSDMWYISDEIVASYPLDENTVARVEILECNDMLRAECTHRIEVRVVHTFRNPLLNCPKDRLVVILCGRNIFKWIGMTCRFRTALGSPKEGDCLASGDG